MPVGDSVGIAAADETTGRHREQPHRPTVDDDRRWQCQPESSGPPGGTSNPAGRDRRRGVRWWWSGRGHRPSVQYAHLSGATLGLANAKGILVDLPNHHECAVGGRLHTNGNGSHLRIPTKE